MNQVRGCNGPQSQKALEAEVSDRTPWASKGPGLELEPELQLELGARPQGSQLDSSSALEAQSLFRREGVGCGSLD